jgi:hypothetical protein
MDETEILPKVTCTCGYVDVTRNRNVLWTQVKIIPSQIAALDGLGGSRMGTKENKVAKAGRHTVIQKYFFFLEILINVKAGRVN